MEVTSDILLLCSGHIQLIQPRATTTSHCHSKLTGLLVGVIYLHILRTCIIALGLSPFYSSCLLSSPANAEGGANIKANTEGGEAVQRLLALLHHHGLQ